MDFYPNISSRISSANSDVDSFTIGFYVSVARQALCFSREVDVR
ncbi:MAG: hypothetical protein ACJAX5_002018 [Patiriisocius sp.]|jgi:hypothetical protein